MPRDRHRLGELLDEAFENAPVPTVIVDADGVWLRANRSMCDLVGYREDELLDRRPLAVRRSIAPGARTTPPALRTSTPPNTTLPPTSTGFSAITHPDDLYLDAEYVERLLTGDVDSYRIEKRYLHRDGREVWVDLHASLVRDAGGAPRFFVYQSEDISSRKEMEQALRRSENDFRLLAENATDVISRHTLDGTIVYITPSCEGLYGYRPDELVGLGLSTLCDARDLDRVGRELERLKAGTAPVRVELRVKKKDASVVWVEATAKLLFGDLGTEIHLAARDVQAQKAAEAQVRSSEERFRTLIEGAPDAVLVTTGGRVAYANPALVRFLHYDSAKEIIGRPASSLFSGPQVRPSGEWVAWSPGVEEERGPEARVSGRPYQRHMLRKDGVRMPTEIAELAIDFDGQPSTLLYARDVAERERLVRKLVQADRRAAIGTLAAGIAHEINNPLAYVLANLELAIEALDDPDAERKDEVRELLREAEKGAAHVREVVRDMRQLSTGGGETEKGLVDLKHVIEVTLRVSMSQIRQKGQLRTDLRDVPPVLARAAQLEQVILNLLVNAVQALPEDGRTDHEIFVGLGMRGNKVVAEIKDTGPGIPKAIQARIFDPFFTTRTGSAVGLGLSIAQATIQELGGELQVESEPERGSAFRVILPAADLGAPSQADHPTPLPPPGAPRRARVLVIDDEKPVALALARALGAEHDVDVAVSAAEGLQQLVVADYDVIFCDLMMSDMSGPLIFERAIAKDPKVQDRFVFITGGAFTPRARAFIEETTNVVIQKPYDLTRLRKVIAERMLRGK